MTRIALIGAGSYGFTHKLVGDLLTYDALQDVDLAFMDIERLCAPGATVLNYTNPQAPIVMACARRSSVPLIGLCHSVQGTTQQIATFLDVPCDEMVYEAAGINHMNWITRLEHRGQDLYPRLRDTIREHGIFNPPGGPDSTPTAFLGPARLDMLNRVGYVVTESSTHFPEYVPFYARTQELIDYYRVPIDQYKRNMENKARDAEDFYQKALDHELPPVERSVEYGCRIVNAMLTNEPIRVYANAMNDGTGRGRSALTGSAHPGSTQPSLVSNLPAFSAVEVACLVDAGGVHPCRFGELPTAVAALCRMEIHVHQLAVEAILERDRRKVYQALMMDPLTHSVMTIDQMESLVDELIAGQQEWLGQYLP